jgi:hypothetical protein
MVLHGIFVAIHWTKASLFKLAFHNIEILGAQ